MRQRAFNYPFLALVSLLSICGRIRATEITWGAFCATDYPLHDENGSNLEGQLPDSGCAHGPYDLVYLVWDRDADGREYFETCERVLSGDTVVDSSFIGTGILCPSCSTGGFSKDFSWEVTTGECDTFYVMAFNDSTLGLATRYGRSGSSVWEVCWWDAYDTIACTETYRWGTDLYFTDPAIFGGVYYEQGGLVPGQKRVPMEMITARIPFSSIPWTSIRVDNGPSAGCTNDSLDIDSVKIYRETLDPRWFDPDEDSLIGEAEWGPGPPDGGTATVTFFEPETLTDATKYYYIVFDISPLADRENCVAACVQDSSYMGLPEFCRDGDFPICSFDLGLPVEISRFDALPGDREVTLRWTTESEIDNKGFNLYTSLLADGVFSKLNEELIPGAGNSSLPIDYEYVDEGLDNGTRYFYKLESVTYGNVLSPYEKIVSAVPAREHRRGRNRTVFNMSGTNPCVCPVQISCTLAGDRTSWTELEVYDISGRLVETLFAEDCSPGDHVIWWDGQSRNGERVSAGTYFCRLSAETVAETRKMVVVE